MPRVPRTHNQSLVHRTTKGDPATGVDDVIEVDMGKCTYNQKALDVE